MRVNVYAEEMTDRIEIITKEIDGRTFTGLRFYLELPVTTVNGKQVQGPFIHRPGDDDSAAVTFWGKQDLRDVLWKALGQLDDYYAARGDRRPPFAQGSALADIMLERRRQISHEGWTPEHDDNHKGSELAMAAAAYCEHATNQDDYVPGFWPWEQAAWKPKDARRDLVRAGALIVAEIERLDRAARES